MAELSRANDGLASVMTTPQGVPPAATGLWANAAAVILVAYFAGFLAFAILAQRGLVADGAAYFVEILTRHAVFSPEISRWAANLLMQWPMLLALRTGVTDVATLSYLFSFGLFYLSVFTLALSWFLLPAERKPLFVLPLLTLVFGWMGSSYAAISQSHVAALWFWPTAFALAGGGLRSSRGAAIILLLVLPTILMHEAMCLFGPILTAITWRRACREERPMIRSLWLLLGLWLLAGAALALYFTLVPISPEARHGFIAGLIRLRFLYQAPGLINPPVVIALVSGVAMALCCRGADAWARRFLAIWLPAYGALLLTCALAPIVFPASFAPRLQFEGRSWVVAVPLLLGASLVAERARLLAIGPTARPLLAIIVALATAAQITWQVAATLRWSAFIAEIRQVLENTRGYVPYETAFAVDTPIGPAAFDIGDRLDLFPQLSIALAPGGRVATIIGNPLPIRWQAFDPTRPAKLPAATGIDYSDYVKALTTP